MQHQSEIVEKRSLRQSRINVSSNKQLFVKGRNVAARTLYGRHVSEDEPRTAEQIATDFDLPREAVLKAIAYCESDPPEIREDWEREEANVQRRFASRTSASGSAHRRHREFTTGKAG